MWCNRSQGNSRPTQWKVKAIIMVTRFTKFGGYFQGMNRFSFAISQLWRRWPPLTSPCPCVAVSPNPSEIVENYMVKDWYPQIIYNYLEPQTTIYKWLFNWMIPNLYIGNGDFTKHPFWTGCLGFQVDINMIPKWLLRLDLVIHLLRRMLELDLNPDVYRTRLRCVCWGIRHETVHSSAASAPMRSW